MKLVITGASGNVGTALLRTLPDPTWEVLAIARRPPPAAQPYSRARWLACDIGDDAAQPVLREAFAGADAIVHLAWAIHPHSGEPPMERTNRTGTAHVLGAAALSGVGHLTCASSVAAYTPAPRWQRVDEHWALTGHPGSAYSMGKVLLETQLDAFAQAHPAIGLARIRPCGILHPQAAAEARDWLLSRWFPRAVIGRPWLPVPLWRGLRLQFVDADDVATAIWAILSRQASGAFNIAAEPVLSASALAQTFGGFRLPMAPRIVTAAAAATWRAGLQPLHPGWLELADRACLIDTSRARSELGWVPGHSAIEAATELATAMRASSAGVSPALAPTPQRLRLGRPTHQDQNPRHRPP